MIPRRGAAKLTRRALPFLAAPALAQAPWAPDRPIRWIVGFAPGGVGDTTARLVAPRLAEALGQPVVIENRPGAGGIVASETVARAAPDGHTLLLVTATAATAPHLFRTLPYHPIDDFTPVSQLAFFHHAIVTAANSPYGDLRALIAAALAPGARVNLGSVSVGTALHLSLALFQSMGGLAGAEIVTYRSTGELLTATMAGDIAAAMEVAATTLPGIEGGRLRALAVTSPTRIARLPDVPTVAEQGMPDYAVRTWNGVAGPARMPAAITERLHRELARIMREAEIRARLEPLAVEPIGGTPSELLALLRAETELWGRVIRAANIERQ
ncbi:MAG: tripartite tricarboxylate transporter substrate binding protein [Alphaproteobacteria bacterium]|nr:tripartite tricarboxylate transporter substrate binding protein [Alphaproteobacteria bacterium]